MLNPVPLTILLERTREREREKEIGRQRKNEGTMYEGADKRKRETQEDADLFDLYSFLNLVEDPGTRKGQQLSCTPSCGKNY